MKFVERLAGGRHAMVSTLRLWLVFVAFTAGAALLIAVLQRIDTALSRPPVPTVPTTASEAVEEGDLTNLPSPP
jgi:hypothetical protein